MVRSLDFIEESHLKQGETQLHLKFQKGLSHCCEEWTWSGVGCHSGPWLGPQGRQWYLLEMVRTGSNEVCLGHGES